MRRIFVLWSYLFILAGQPGSAAFICNEAGHGAVLESFHAPCGQDAGPQSILPLPSIPGEELANASCSDFALFKDFTSTAQFRFSTATPAPFHVNPGPVRFCAVLLRSGRPAPVLLPLAAPFLRV
jgi:hypothetical protein